MADKNFSGQLLPSSCSPSFPHATQKTSSIIAFYQYKLNPKDHFRANQEHLEYFVPVLENELKTAMVDNDNDIIFILIPKDKVPFDSEKMYDVLCDPDDGTKLYNTQEKVWTTYPGHENKQMPLAKFFESLARAIDAILDEEFDRLHWSGMFENTPVPHPYCARKPDGFTSRFDFIFIPADVLVSWYLIFGTGEWKKNEDGRRTAIFQLGEKARLIFTIQLNRRYVVGVTLTGDFLSLVAFDRSGVVASRPINIHKEPALFLHIIIGCLFLNVNEFGLDPTVRYKQPEQPSPAPESTEPPAPVTSTNSAHASTDASETPLNLASDSTPHSNATPVSSSNSDDDSFISITNITSTESITDFWEDAMAEDAPGADFVKEPTTIPPVSGQSIQSLPEVAIPLQTPENTIAPSKAIATETNKLLSNHESDTTALTAESHIGSTEDASVGDASGADYDVGSTSSHPLIGHSTLSLSDSLPAQAPPLSVREQVNPVHESDARKTTCTEAPDSSSILDGTPAPNAPKSDLTTESRAEFDDNSILENAPDNNLDNGSTSGNLASELNPIPSIDGVDSAGCPSEASGFAGPSVTDEPPSESNYVPFGDSDSKEPPLVGEIEVDGEWYDIIDVVHVEGGLCGRGTVCYYVRRNGVYYIVKDRWVVVECAEKEAKILESLQGSNHIPRFIKDVPVLFNGKRDTTAFLRQSPNAKGENVEIREHRRMLLQPCAHTLSNFRDLVELLTAIRDVVDAIETLLDKGITHRDISLSNIMLEKLGRALRGLLIDFDFASLMNGEGEENNGYRTGTLPFMAIGILEADKSTVHSYYHDLESLFYVLLWVCIMHSGPCGALRGKEFKYAKSCVSDWNGASSRMLAIANSKRASMMDEKIFEKRILADFAPYFDPIKPCISSLRDLLFSALSDSTSTIFARTIHDEKYATTFTSLPHEFVNLIKRKSYPRSDPKAFIGRYREILDDTIKVLEVGRDVDKLPPIRFRRSPNPAHIGLYQETPKRYGFDLPDDFVPLMMPSSQTFGTPNSVSTSGTSTSRSAKRRSVDSELEGRASQEGSSKKIKSSNTDKKSQRTSGSYVKVNKSSSRSSRSSFHHVSSKGGSSS